MSEIIRDALDGAIRVMENWLHSGKVDKPTWAMLTAMQTAIDAMRREQRRTNLPYARPCAVLQYHINQPSALLFRDPVTLRTIKTGIAVMERQYNAQRP